MPKPTPEQQKKLVKVTKTRNEVSAEKRGLRAHYDNLRKEAERELDRKLDLAVREAADEGCIIAWIKPAYGTQDFSTIKRILDRTPSLKALQEQAAVDGAYSLREDGSAKYLNVTYHEHGPSKLNGSAVFEVVDLDGVPMFVNIFGEDTEVSRILDGALDGPYYDEAKAWLLSQ